MELSEIAQEIVKIIFNEGNKSILVLTHSFEFKRKTWDYLIREIEHPTFHFKKVERAPSTLHDDKGNKVIVLKFTPHSMNQLQGFNPDYIFLDYMIEEWMNKWEFIRMLQIRCLKKKEIDNG